MDENSTRNVDTNAGFVGRSRVPVEVLGELVANPGQFVDDEVRDRGGSVGLSLLGEERVEAVENCSVNRTVGSGTGPTLLAEHLRCCHDLGSERVRDLT